MSTVETGNQLEDAFYRFLCDQLENGQHVYGVHAPHTCKIYKKKSYFCKVREADVEFDVVVEITGEGREQPHSFLVFECKNLKSAVPETAVTDFSNKLGRIFGHAAKGVLVFSSRLKRGAEKVSRNSGIGLAKFDAHGLEIKADRRNNSVIENYLVERQFFETDEDAKSLKFSAYVDGALFGSCGQLVSSIYSDSSPTENSEYSGANGRVPYLSETKIQAKADSLLREAAYQNGPVDLEQICSQLSLKLSFSKRNVLDDFGAPILGSANFDNRTIEINLHKNKKRERFTIGHEIGHFFLQHGRYLRSESVVERDLFEHIETEEVSLPNNYSRLERQANEFASALLLPSLVFIERARELRSSLQIQDRGHGFIFVDDQPCNYAPYNELLFELSEHFEVSKRAIEIRLKRMGWLNDHRGQHWKHYHR